MEQTINLFTGVFSLIFLGALSNEVIYKLSANIIFKIFTIAMIVLIATAICSNKGHNILIPILFWTAFLAGMTFDRGIDNFIKRS